MQMIKFVILIHLAFEVEIALSQCYTNYTSVQDVLDNLDRITLPVDNFKPKCMGLSCPALLTLPCPYHSDGSIDNAIYSQILSTVQSCLSQQVPICSTPIDPIPMCPMSMTLQSYLSPLGIDGSLALKPNTTFAIGLSTTELTYDPNSSYVYVNIPHLVYESQVLGSVGLEGSGQSYSFQSASASVTVNVSLVLMVRTQPRVSVKVTSTSIIASAQYGQLLTTNPGNNVLAIIQTVLSYAAQAAVQSSNIPKDLGTFIGTIIANAVETAAQKCKPN